MMNDGGGMNKINRRPWFERKFTFDMPVWLFPNVLERLRGTPARLQDRLGLLPAEILTRRDGERWSMQEHAGHLHDLGSLDLARVEDYLQAKENLQAADVNNRKTYEAHHNSVSLKSILDAFRLERAEFVRRLERSEEHTSELQSRA